MPRTVPIDCTTVSALRDSLERASLPLLTRLAALPRIVPFLAVLGLIIAGILVPGWGWVFLAVVVVLLAWILVLAWPRLTLPARMFRLAVLVGLIAATVTQASPRN